MKKFITTVVCMVALATSVLAGPSAYDTNAWSLTLSGVGNTAVNGGATAFGTDIGVSYAGAFGLPSQLDTGVRQGIYYANNAVGDTIGGRTALFADWNVQIYKKLYAFAGVEAASTYGFGKTQWTAGPEIGVKYFLKKDVYLAGQVNYDFQLNGRNGNTDLDNIRYGVGFGIRFK